MKTVKAGTAFDGRKYYDLEGNGPGFRASKLGFRCQRDYDNYYSIGISENIFMTSSFENLSQRIVDSWMGSLSHRENILNSSYESQGIGIYLYNGSLYVTENFC